MQEQVLFHGKSDYHEITIFDTDELDGMKGRFRVMQFASQASQGAIDLDDPSRILFEYPQAIIHLIEHNAPAFERIFAIGHGAGTLSRYFSARGIQIAELDPLVLRLSREYFGYDADSVIVGDGRKLLEHQPSGELDYIILDAFNEQGTPAHLVTSEFFALASAKLNANGAIILNVTGRSGNDRLLSAVAETLNNAFPFTKIFSLKSDQSGDPTNFILAGSKQPLFCQARRMAGFSETRLPAGYVLRDGQQRA
ncbi:spermidine synthase [Paenibacillus pinistramenti]|uniref:spermidine synthase n=1 Tax=Paenibacillus pinistramenti TaxID=1768003 RepID=UPI00193A2841|nr:fused MFS/spermidine synthase [Paenibacillus pinistramenti]